MDEQPSPGSWSPRKRRRLHDLVWPEDEVPVEIFDDITSYLPRSDIKSLRLVNREFEEKVSAKYFRNVVVPFRTEMFKAPRQADDGVETLVIHPRVCSDALFSSGMRIFQSFGSHIFRFALSLELDEDSLAYPPIKPTQKAIASYWGIYRWPHEYYLRYTELEGLEQTADETGSMKDALHCLSKVRELGLCCDAGLGYLSGPDQNLESPPAPHPVFGLRNLRYQIQQRRQELGDEAARDARRHAFGSPKDFKYNLLESMVKSAGYTQAQVKDAIDIILHTEGVSLSSIDFDERAAAVMASALPADEADQPRGLHIVRPPQTNFPELTASHPLQPRNLTRAQKEMLLELEWAHRALIQSYVIAVIDNGQVSTFNCLTTLTIAKIPSSHVFMFQRHDFWNSLPNLTNLAIAVVADWRQVAKIAPGCLEDTYVSPVQAAAKVFHLLCECISRQRNISYLHFEWICGGEFAPGVMQRNRYILPAPFTMPSDMVQPDTARVSDRLLSLPHVEHLSLKNCYFAPHVLAQVLRTMALSSLQKVELESVSLTGPPSITQQPAANAPLAQQPAMQVGQLLATPAQLAQALQIHTQGQAAQWAMPPGVQNQPVGGAVTPNPPPPDPQWEHMRLRNPKLFCWAGIIDHLTPGAKIRELLGHDGEDVAFSDVPEASDESLDFMPEPTKLRLQQKRYHINHLAFKTCGYVSIEAPFINTQQVLANVPPWVEPAQIATRRKELSVYMQTCTDKLAGRIINYIDMQETYNLMTAFGMDTSWTGVYEDQVIDAAKDDGVVHPGKGRFSGVITERNREEINSPVVEFAATR